ncbi:5-deoxy-glucuronate isomerase [Clostridium septicum]|uniref:5-deoxy-glucuronate isomerase n=1 Tax=Clostridium septicum TaxID=1504 RepID=UPI003217BA92
MVENIGFGENGVKIVTEINGKHSNMLMDICVVKINKGDELEILDPKKEVAVLLMEGKIKYIWKNNEVEVSRKNVFEEEGYCLHVCKNEKIRIEVIDNAEILIQKAENHREFEDKLYTPDDVIVQISSLDKWDSTAARKIKTFFDYNNAPYSNMVNGEIVSYPGRWSSYIPHEHPQPEVYYYKFDKKQGFGACFIGDNAYKVKDGGYAVIEGGYTHPQATAPGYRMYYCWMIRHLEGNPWTERIDDPDHIWLLDEK